MFEARSRRIQLTFKFNGKQGGKRMAVAAVKVLYNLELTTMILQWLKIITFKEHKIAVRENQKPVLPKAWTSSFALLATVNRVFFHASIEVLWERQVSFAPLFGYVLPADRDKNGHLLTPLSYQDHKLTCAHWERFKFYASKMKALVLDNGSPRIRTIWLSHLLDSAGRPTTLLPSLQRLFIASTNPLALHIAYNSLPVVRFIEADLSAKSDGEARDNSKAFTTGLHQGAVCLTKLHFVQTMTNNLIKNIGRIGTLTSLQIAIGHKEAKTLNLGKLAAIPWLKQLRIKENLDPTDETAAAMFPGKATRDLERLSAQKSHLPHLRELTIEASGTTQVHIAATLFPANLEVLDLLVLPDRKSVQVVLVPLVVTIYANRNTSLTTLRVDTPEKPMAVADVDALKHIRNDTQHNKLEPFLESITNLHHLRHLTIRDIAFIAADVVPRLLKVASCLPSLETLVIDPTPLTGLEEDNLELLTLEALEDIVVFNSSLRRLEIAVDITPGEVPDPPEDDVQPHNLELLALYSSGHDACTIEDKFSLARYLDSLFPRVRILTSAWKDGHEDQEFWVFIDQALQFSRDSCDQALRRLEKSQTGE